VGKNVVPDVAVIGDLAETLPALLPMIEERRHQVWIQEIKEWRVTPQSDIINYEVDELIPPFVIRQLWHATHRIRNEPPIIVTDVGQHQMWECQYFIHDQVGHAAHQRRSGHDGLCAAGGDRRADGHPDRLVWAVAGDGGFQMTLQELAVHQAGARSAGQDRHHQQRLPGHGAPVAAVLLRQALHRHADLVARFRQAGRGLRHSRSARHAPG
jgi:acetolactate synthase-1/2/3 large subunit